MDATVRRVLGEAARDTSSKSIKGKPQPMHPFTGWGGGGGHNNFMGFVPRNVLAKALDKPKPKPKPKRMAESYRIPATFSADHPTWIKCRNGNVGVRWTGRDWMVVGTGLGIEHCDERDLRYTVRDFCSQLDGNGGYFLDR